MAYVEYTRQKRTVKNMDTFETITRYLKNMDFFPRGEAPPTSTGAPICHHNPDKKIYWD